MGRRIPEFDQRLREIADRLAAGKVAPAKPVKKQPSRASTPDVQDGIRGLMNGDGKKSRKV
jgi:hypothetical protein